MNIVIEIELDEDEKEGNVYVKVDDSLDSEIDLNDVERESSGVETIFNDDGEQEKFREYIKNLGILHSP
jgi:hypothetical protein